MQKTKVVLNLFKGKVRKTVGFLTLIYFRIIY
jgi:hypothetical protein